MIMMTSGLKLVLIFGAALGLYHFNTKNTSLFWPPHNTNITDHLTSAVAHNTNNTDQLTTSAVQLDPGFDYFLFVLQWPAAFCNIQRTKQRKCNPDHPLLKHQEMFTVHGLWPQLYSAKSPLSCSTTQSMQDNDLIAFQNDLLEYWPNLFSAQNFQSSKNFWKYEWNKHGKCSSNKFNPQQYLRITLDLAKKYAKPIYGEIDKRGINPDGITPYGGPRIREAVKQITKYDPMLNMQLNGLGEHLLLEIYLCVKKDGVTLFDCDSRYRFAAP